MPQANESKPAIVGIPVDGKTPEYVERSRGESGVGIRLVEFLAQHAGLAFTEPDLAQEFGFIREDGKPHQQRVNGPMSKIWEVLQESGEQPVEGFTLRCLKVAQGGKHLKAWAMAENPA